MCYNTYNNKEQELELKIENAATIFNVMCKTFFNKKYIITKQRYLTAIVHLVKMCD